MRASLPLSALACLASLQTVGCGPVATDAATAQNDAAAATPDVPEQPQVEAGIELCADDVAAPEDPGASAEGWSAVGGAVIDYEGVGALFLSEAVCAGDAEMRKTVEMPACFLPLAFNMSSNILSSGNSYGPMDATGARLGGALLDFGYSEYDTRRCVGAAAFGGAADVVIRPRTAYSHCEEAVGEVADVSLTLEPSCPAPGTVVPYEDWTLYGFNEDVEASRAEVVDGNLELEIFPGFCADARAEGPSIGALALPDSAGAGIMITVDAELSEVVPEDYDGGLYMRLGRLGAYLRPGENRICFPKAMRGSTNRLGLFLSHQSCSSSSAPARSVVIHPIAFIDDCPEGDVVDGSFDDASPLWMMLPAYQAGSVAIEDGAATLVATHECDAPRIDGNVSVPAATAEGGPALVVQYTKDGGGLGAVHSGDLNVYAELLGSESEARVCLPPSRANDLIAVSLSVTTETGGSGTCANPVPSGATTLVVDEVSVVLDPACPSE